jgi:protocatechuate 3,4-dioxygenase beta subunit
VSAASGLAVSTPVGSALSCVPTAGGPDQGDTTSTDETPSDIVLGPAPGLTQAPTVASPIRMIISGRVVDEHCQPLADTTLAIHQTNPDGVYGPSQLGGPASCPCYYVGRLRTDANGTYRFVTARPGYYKDAPPPPPPSHIHIFINHPAAIGLGVELSFDDDPWVNDASYVPANDTVIIHIDSRCDSIGEYQGGTFDIVLRSQ